MPNDILDDKLLEFEIETGLEPTEDNLKDHIETMLIDEKFSIKKIEDFGKLIVDSYGDLQEFANRWRQHFIDHAKPQYMPGGWEVDRPLELIK